jgi:hypothetical protein
VVSNTIQLYSLRLSWWSTLRGLGQTPADGFLWAKSTAKKMPSIIGYTIRMAASVLASAIIARRCLEIACDKAHNPYPSLCFTMRGTGYNLSLHFGPPAQLSGHRLGSKREEITGDRQRLGGDHRGTAMGLISFFH